MIGTIFDIKEFGVNDGPGLLTTVFLKGCPLRCAWCHNPEGLKCEKQLMVRQRSCKHCGLCLKGCSHPECQPFKRCVHICPDNLVSIVGEDLSARELSDRINVNKGVITGVTFSGGEPLFQPDFLLETISYLSNLNINIETSGYCTPDVFAAVLAKTDLVYLDIKLADDCQHRQYTGVSNEPILRNLKTLQHSGKKAVIRTPLIPGITDTAENLAAIDKLIDGMPHQLLPYNTMANLKYEMLGIPYPLGVMKND